MASTEVGTAYVTLLPSAKGFAKNLQKEIAREFAGSGLDKAIADALGDRKPVKLPVKPDVDPKTVPDELPVPPGKEPTLPVELDPLIRQFQQQVAREVAALAREVNASIPISASTAELRSELAAQITAVERELRAEVPTEPAGRREYEAKLRALVDQATDRVRAAVRVEPEVDRARWQARLMQGISGALGQVSSAASTVVGAASAAVSSLTGLATALLAAAAAASFLVPGTYLLGGALGALPGIIAGVVAAVGALSLGLMGIADHFKEAAAGGGGAGEDLAAQARRIAQATRRVEAAQRSLARAQREVVLAQEAVTRAREAEVERLEDLQRALRRARLDEEDAALRLREAERALVEARQSGDVLAIQRADLAYRQAVLGLEEARDATEDLAREQQRAARVGVEGSDQVQEALRRQQDAIEAVTAAQEQLLAAEEQLQAARERPSAGGGGAAQELAELAPAAQEFVDAVKGLAPAFEQLRLGVQQKLFAGLGGVVRNLAQAWMPQLNKTLGAYATTFNELLKTTAKSVSQKSFIDNISAGAESARRALERIGKAVSGPLVDAFGRLARAAGPFIERLGDEVAQLVEDFAAWIEQVDKSGSLDRFFTRAGQILGDLFEMGRDVASIFGSIMSILFGEEPITTTPWNALRETLDQLADWFKRPENQEKVRKFFDDVEKFMTQDLPNAIRTAKSVIDTVDGWLDTVERWRERIERFRDAVVAAFAVVGGALRGVASPITFALGQFGRLWDGVSREAGRVSAAIAGLPGRIVAALGNTGGLLWQAGRNIVQGLIDGIRSRFPSIGSTMSALAGLIAAYLPHSPAKMGPLSGRGSPYHSGQSIARMLASGVTDTLGTVESAAADLAGVFATTGSSPVPAVSAPVAPTPGRLVAEWIGGDGDPVIRAIREHVRIYYGGSVQAALGT